MRVGDRGQSGGVAGADSGHRRAASEGAGGRGLVEAAWMIEGDTVARWHDRTGLEPPTCHSAFRLNRTNVRDFVQIQAKRMQIDSAQSLTTALDPS